MQKIKRGDGGKRYISLLVVVLLLVGIVWLCPIKDEVSIRIEYSSRKYDNSFQAQLFWKTDGGYSAKESSIHQVRRNRVSLELLEKTEAVTELRLDPIDQEKETAITSIQVRNHGIHMGLIPVREILEKAAFYRMEEPEVKRGMLYIYPQGNDPVIVLGKDLVEEYFASCNTRLRAVVSGWIVAAGLLVAVGIRYKNLWNTATNRISGQYEGITKGILGIAVFLVAYMAVQSFDYAHPDENMSKAAIDYYMTHWQPADIRNPEVADSFSAYGNSRLTETTFYYFLAGKVAWIAKNLIGMDKYYRAFNVLLFVVMTGIFYKKGRQNGFLFLMLGLTPQIWYIFSYATSDGWDYFLSFLILYQLTIKKSMFYRALESSSVRIAVGGLVAVGALYGALLLGKKNYYFVFLASFFFLLYRLIKTKKQKRMQITIKYAIIVAVCMVVYCGTKYMDIQFYHGNKNLIILEQREDYAEKGEVLEGIWDGVRLREQGVGLRQFFEEYGFLRDSYRSYTGYYGWMEYESPCGYYLIIGLLYCFFMVLLWKTVLTDRGKWKGILFGVLMGLSAAIVATSAWHSWTSDFQPQGRYLFAINFILAVCGCMYYGGLFDKKSVRLVLCAIGCLSVYSFLFSGIFSLA